MMAFVRHHQFEQVRAGADLPGLAIKADAVARMCPSGQGRPGTPGHRHVVEKSRDAREKDRPGDILASQHVVETGFVIAVTPILEMGPESSIGLQVVRISAENLVGAQSGKQSPMASLPYRFHEVCMGQCRPGAAWLS